MCFSLQALAPWRRPPSHPPCSLTPVTMATTWPLLNPLSCQFPVCPRDTPQPCKQRTLWDNTTNSKELQKSSHPFGDKDLQISETSTFVHISNKRIVCGFQNSARPWWELRWCWCDEQQSTAAATIHRYCSTHTIQYCQMLQIFRGLFCLFVGLHTWTLLEYNFHFGRPCTYISDGSMVLCSSSCCCSQCDMRSTHK